MRFSFRYHAFGVLLMLGPSLMAQQERQTPDRRPANASRADAVPMMDANGRLQPSAVSAAELLEIAATNVKRYGAAGDGRADDTVALQAALDAAAPNVGPLATAQFGGTRTIFLPKGTYKISRPLRFYSGQRIHGDGRSTVIQASEDFRGPALLWGMAASSNQIAGVEIGRLTLQAGTGVAAISYDASDTMFLNNRIHDIFLNCVDGLILGGYAQANHISKIYSWGPIDRLLYLQGNHNFVDGLDKEGSSSNGTDAYVTIERHSRGDSANNVLLNVLIEGKGSARKTPMRLIGAGGTMIENYWMECSQTNGYALHVENSANVRLSGAQRVGLVDTGKLKLVNATVHVDSLDVSSSPVPFNDYLDVDAQSKLVIDDLYSRFAANGQRLTVPQVAVLRHSNAKLREDRPQGWLAESMGPAMLGRNLLVNASWDAGDFGWTTTGGQTLAKDETLAGDIGQGRMRHWVASAVSTTFTFQTLTVSPAMVGLPVTLQALVKVQGGEARAVPYFSGSGVEGHTGYGMVTAGSGWAVLTQTVTPAAPGALQAGIRWAGAKRGDEMWMGDVSVGVGANLTLQPASSQSYNLGGKNFAVGDAPPKSGSWRAGDVVFASNYPSHWGWVCTKSGSPGEWKEMRDPADGSGSADTPRPVRRADAGGASPVPGKAGWIPVRASISEANGALQMTAAKDVNGGPRPLLVSTPVGGNASSSIADRGVSAMLRALPHRADGETLRVEATFSTWGPADVEAQAGCGLLIATDDEAGLRGGLDSWQSGLLLDLASDRLRTVHTQQWASRGAQWGKAYRSDGQGVLRLRLDEQEDALQWQVFAGGNWRTVESMPKSVASAAKYWGVGCLQPPGGADAGVQVLSWKEGR